MIEQIQRFLDALDKALVPHAAKGERLELYAIGRSALILHYGLRLATAGTKDFDVVKIGDSFTPLARKALELFGKGTDSARQLGLYVDMVQDGLPPLPMGFRGRCQEVEGGWQVIRVWRLEIHDLAATKLRCFRPQDRDDLQFLCDAQKLRADKLKEALDLAFIWSMEKDGDPNRDRAFVHLERVILYLQGRSRTL
ncbi:MAG TPA: DUF6036 family nucleotidyltransferase [Gemmataceae bacterium]|jgi:hypothetical protein|nr:DUF6036 family nucleotidyltransferase [Gemmataceae bacterium]